MALKMLCEYRMNPAGVDCTQPLLSWYQEEGVTAPETARITVRPAGDETLVWDSGDIANAGCIRYAGAPLRSGRTYLWQLRLGCEKPFVSQEASFTMGLLPQDPWQAHWVGGIRIDAKCYLYRHERRVDKPVRRAAAFVASPNYNVLTVNGRNADDSVLNNTFANYDKSLYYVTYDLTGLIHQGSNALGVMTGLGWRSLREAEDGIGWGDSLFAMQVWVEYDDGSEDRWYSVPDRWRYCTDGPVVYNSIYNGEIYDARREKTGWDCPGYDDSTWSDAVEKEPPEGVLRAQLLEPIRVMEELPVQEIIPVADGSWTLDFGRNLAGWVKLRICGEAGQRISIKPAELLRADSSVNPTSLRGAHPVDTYILRGEGEEVWEPRFTYHGFRYAQIFGLTGKPGKAMFTACLVRTAVERIGHFRTSHPTVQAFYDMVVRTEECNLHGVPTDCPQRDERLGWLNDMTVRNEGAMYGFRMYQLYAKWLRDIRDTQGKVTGAITDTAPFLRYGFRPADPVSGSFLQLPWNLYLHYGDDRIIRENYEANARWVRYLLRNSNDGVVCFSSMGDWAAPVAGTDHGSTGGGALSVITPQLLMSTGFLYHDCTLMAKMAHVLGKEEDRKLWNETAARVRSDFNRAFFRPVEEYYATNSQASNILPLYFGLVKEEYIPGVLRHLCEDIRRNGGHLNTGNICTRYAIEVLFRYGEEDLAWHLLSQTEYPSWGFMLKNGATTLWERWEKVDEGDFMADMAAMNHPMNGGAVVSLYKHLAGILPDEEKPGWQNVIFRPVLPKDAPDAAAELMTVRGKVCCNWRRQPNGAVLEVTVPLGCTGTVYLPGQPEPERVGSGRHCFLCREL